MADREYTTNVNWSPRSGDFAEQEAAKKEEARLHALARQQEKDRNARFKAALMATYAQSQPAQGQTMDSFIRNGGNRGQTHVIEEEASPGLKMSRWMRSEVAKKEVTELDGGN